MDRCLTCNQRYADVCRQCCKAELATLRTQLATRKSTKPLKIGDEVWVKAYIREKRDDGVYELRTPYMKISNIHFVAMEENIRGA